MDAKKRNKRKGEIMCERERCMKIVSNTQTYYSKIMIYINMQSI